MFPTALVPSPFPLFYPDGESQTAIGTGYPSRDKGVGTIARGRERINSGGNVLVVNFFLFGMVNDGASRWGCAKGVTVSTSYHFPVTLLSREIACTWWKEGGERKGV